MSEDSLPQLSAPKLSVPLTPVSTTMGRTSHRIFPFSLKRHDFYVQQALDGASWADVQSGYSNLSARKQIKAAL